MNDIYPTVEGFESIVQGLDDPDVPDEEFTAALEELPPIGIQARVLALVSIRENHRVLAAALREREKLLALRRQSLERRIQGLEKYLVYLLDTAGVAKVESDLFRVRLRTNPPSVPDALLDRAKVPDEYWRECLIRELDKAAVIEAYRHGVLVPGAPVVQTKGITIR